MREPKKNFQFYILESNVWILNRSIFIKLIEGLRRLYREKKRCLTGQNWGEIKIRKTEITFCSRPKTIIIFLIDYDKLLKVSINSLEESISLEFKQEDIIGMQLKEIIFLTPNRKTDDELSMSEILSKQIEKKSNLIKKKKENFMHFTFFTVSNSQRKIYYTTL